MVGYRADDSYFSFASDFVNNTLSLRDLSRAMHLGKLGEQVVLMSRMAFDRIEFQGYVAADRRVYYYRRIDRDRRARSDYADAKKDLPALRSDLFVLDIIREDMKNDDPRLRALLSG